MTIKNKIDVFVLKVKGIGIWFPSENRPILSFEVNLPHIQKSEVNGRKPKLVILDSLSLVR